MAHGPTYRVPMRRRRTGRTDFRHRLRLLKSRQPRVVVRRTNNNMIVQFIEFDGQGDKIVATGQATELRKLGFTGHTGNTTAAYLAGLLAGARAKKAGIESGVLDIGQQAPVPGARIFAGLAGALEAGVDIPHGESVLPKEERYASHDEFEAVKAKILGGGSE